MVPHNELSAKFSRRGRHREVELFPPSVPRCLIRGSEVSVYYNRQQTGGWERHRRDQAEIAIMFGGGSCRLGWNSHGRKWSEYELRAPNVCVIAPNVLHSCHLGSQTELLVVYVAPPLLERAIKKRIRGILFSDVAHHDLILWLLASLLRHCCIASSPPSSRTIESVGGELACWLIEMLLTPPPVHNGKMRRFTATQREKVLSYMRANMKHDIHVIDLSRQTGHSLSHFTELFTATFGRAPYHYLKEVRLLKGYEMLMTGDYLVREAALAVGYSNPDHFSEIFQAYFRCSPKELLMRVRGSPVKSPP